MYRYYKYYSYVTQKEYQECVKRYSMLGAPPNCPRPTTKAEHDAALEKLRGLTPRKSEGQPPGNPPFGLGILSGLANRPPSRPYKSQGTQTSQDRKKTPQERVTACQNRLRAHINRVNAHTNIPAAHKAEMLAKLNAKILDCTTPRGLDKEEKDKDHKDADPRGYGRLVSQITPGKLRKDPNILATLLQQIFDFFKNITNPPRPVQKVLENYPPPPYTTTTVPPRVTTS